jgi:FixJ family two-component response regulator
MDSKLKVLYIDDEENNLFAFRATFRLDYKVFTAINSQAALKILSQENGIVVIICDQRMPDKTGVDFFEEVSKLFPRPMRLLMSGYTDIESVINAVNKGNIFRFMHKPWNEDAIRSVVNEAAQNYMARNFDLNSIFLEKNGYIIWDMPSEKRSVFVDLIKGFEEYALLKGYRITFSADNSIPNKIAFKFTMSDEAPEEENIRTDILEYIEKIKNGSVFDDMPTIISRGEHALVSATLKNRLSFLYHNLELHRTGLDFYRKLINELPENINVKMPSFIINNVDDKSKHLTASHSSNILHGKHLAYDNNVDNSIRITGSFNKKKEQISKLEEVIKLLREEKDMVVNLQQELITSFDKVREEVSEEEKPEKTKIFKWLSNTKKTAESLVLSHEITEAIRWIYNSFNFSV